MALIQILKPASLTSGWPTCIAITLSKRPLPKASIRNELQLRGMALALGSQLAQRSENSLPSLQGWLAQFVKDGALTADQAQHSMAQARALQS